MEKEVKQGKVLLLVIAGFFFLFELILATSEHRFGEPITSTEIFRVFLTVILFYLSYRGYRWSRILMAVFSWVAVISMGVLSLFTTPFWIGLSSELNIVFQWTILVLVTTMFGISAYLLTFSKKIQSFQEFQERKFRTNSSK